MACRSIVIAGKEYGTGSSRDWAAKGPHAAGRQGRASPNRSSASTAATWWAWACCRSSFKDGQNAESLGLTGRETLTSSASRTTSEAASGTDGQGDQGRRHGHHLQRHRAARYAGGRGLLPNGGILPTVLRKLVQGRIDDREGEPRPEVQPLPATIGVQRSQANSMTRTSSWQSSRESLSGIITRWTDELFLVVKGKAAHQIARPRYLAGGGRVCDYSQRSSQHLPIAEDSQAHAVRALEPKCHIFAT